MQQSITKPAPKRPERRANSPMQSVWQAAKAKGLPTDAQSRDARAYAVNFYLRDTPYLLIESFKDLLADDVLIEIVSGAIFAGELKW